MSMDDARQDVNTFDIRMAGHIDKVEEKKRSRLVSQPRAPEQHSMKKAFWERQDQFASN